MSTQILTNNSKTLLSFDIARFSCFQKCTYCYVNTTETLYKAYSEKIKNNLRYLLNDPIDLAKKVSDEYKRKQNSKNDKWKPFKTDNMPLRIYGSGDYTKPQFEFLNNLSIPFYIISKNLTYEKMENEFNKLEKISNLKQIILSLDTERIGNYNQAKKLKNISNKTKIAFTGTIEEFEAVRGLGFDIFFNIEKTKKVKNLLQEKNYAESCPCDSGKIAHNSACSICTKCYK